MARFILTLNNEVLGSYQVTEGQQFSIGRNPNNQMVIDNMAVSSYHAKVNLKNGRLFINDMGSRNGTIINNQRTQEGMLAHQDWVTIGKHILIVDLYESISLESAARELKAMSSMDDDSDQTMMLDPESVQTAWVGFDYLSFISAVREDFELTGKRVYIGKGQDADIRISGLWSFLAATPSATLTPRQDNYFLEHAGGKLKPKINGKRITAPVRLKHKDVIKIGPVEMQFRRVRRPSV